MQKELRILSRGGQGAVTAAKILVGAALIEGRYAQMIPNFGQERKGAPVFTFARVSDEPILSHTYVYNPDIVLLFDPYLVDVGIDPTEGLNPGAILAVNSADPSAYAPAKSFAKVGYADAVAITAETVGPVPPNAAMLGILSRVTGVIGLEALIKAIHEAMPGSRGEKNAACAKAAYERTVIYENK